MHKRMLPYWLKGRKNTKSKNQKVVKAKTWRTKILSNCAVYGSKKSRFLN